MTHIHTKTQADVNSRPGNNEHKEREKAKGKHGWEKMKDKTRMIFLSEKSMAINSQPKNESSLTFNTLGAAKSHEIKSQLR